MSVSRVNGEIPVYFGAHVLHSAHAIAYIQLAGFSIVIIVGSKRDMGVFGSMLAIGRIKNKNLHRQDHALGLS